MNNFVTYQVAKELVTALKPIIEQLKRFSAEATDQVERAAISILFNIAEGNRRYGKDPRKYYATAAGSTSEVLAALDLAHAWEWPVDDRRVRELIDRLRALLWRLVHPKRKSAAATRLTASSDPDAAAQSAEPVRPAHATRRAVADRG